MRIFSYVINFIRFRESQTSVIDEHFNSLDKTKNAIEQTYLANQDKQDALAEMQRNRANVEQAIKDKEKRSQELKTRLLDLKRGQERVAEKLERAKAEQARLRAMLEEKTNAAVSLRRDADKLRPYTQQSPAVLEQNLRDLGVSLAADKAEIERLERRDRALRTSADTFALLHGDVANLTRLLGDVQEELRKEDDEAARANKHRDALSERSNNVREVERQERLLHKQLTNWTERTDNLRRGAEEKQEIARSRMEELKAVHEDLGRERRKRGEEIERRRVRIETVEKKVSCDIVCAILGAPEC